MAAEALRDQQRTDSRFEENGVSGFLRDGLGPSRSAAKQNGGYEQRAVVQQQLLGVSRAGISLQRLARGRRREDLSVQ